MSKRPPSELGPDAAGGPPSSNGAKAPRLDGTFTGTTQPTAAPVAANNSNAAAAATSNHKVTDNFTAGRILNYPTKAAKDARTRVLEYTGSDLARQFEEAFDKEAGKSTVQVTIKPDYFSAKNKQVATRQLFGDAIYSGDSDLVCVLMHMGFYPYHLPHAPANASLFKVSVQILPSQIEYSSKMRNRIRSRYLLPTTQSCSITVLQCWVMSTSGASIELSPNMDCPTVHPTYMPSLHDRQIHTRSSAAAGSTRQKAMADVSLRYNMCQEPWLAFRLENIGDRGLRPSQRTSARLHEEVLYLEGHTSRYQLTFVGMEGETGNNNEDQLQPDRQELYCWSLCKQALPLTLMRQKGIPLPSDEIEVLEADLKWEELKWGNEVLYVRNTPYELFSLLFMPVTKAADASA